MFIDLEMLHKLAGRNIALRYRLREHPMIAVYEPDPDDRKNIFLLIQSSLSLLNDFIHKKNLLLRKADERANQYFGPNRVDSARVNK
jgi:hypothetical protein